MKTRRILSSTVIFVLTLVVAAGIVPAAWAQAQQSSYTLTDAVTLALTHHPQVRAAEQEVRSAEAAVKIQRAGLSPTASVSVGGAATGGSTGTTVSSQVATGVSYPLFDGGLQQAKIRQAEAQAEGARQNLAAVRADVAVAAVSAYMDVVSAEQVAVLREQAVAQVRAQLDAARAKVNAGTAPQADVIRAESDLATAEFNLIDAQSDLGGKRSVLLAAIGLDPASPVGVVAPAAPDAVALSEQQVLDRVAQRPTVLQAQSDVRSSEAALAIAMLQNGVSVTLDGRYVLISTGSASSSQSGTWSIGPTISLPVYDGGKSAAQVEQARANLEAAKASLDNSLLSARSAAIQDRLQVVAAQVRVDAAQRAVTAATESLRVAEGRYRAGVGTALEVSSAQTDLISAQVSLVQAAAQRWTGTANLRRAIGMPVIGER